VVACFCLFSILSFVAPATRASYRLEVNYNEGWNAYNSEIASHHFPLYPSKYGWTTVNYPPASFYLIAYLAPLLGDPVLVGRVLSLLSLVLSSACVAVIVKRLTTRWTPSIFAASFCLALFCGAASSYVGMNDPQMLAHPFFLFGLLLCLEYPMAEVGIPAIVTLFVIGGSIKQNLLPVPLAVFSDLLVVSRAKAMRFLVYSIILLGACIAISTVVGGPFFVSNMLTPRHFSFIRAMHLFLLTYGTLQIPFLASLVWAVWHVRSSPYRVIALYFWASLLIGLVAAGGQGVNVNTVFDNFFAMSIIMGLLLDAIWQWPVVPLQRNVAWRLLPPLFLCCSAIFTFAQSPYLNIPKFLAKLRSQQDQFTAEVRALSIQAGPAICESLLRCYYAGKPYLVDPFNSTSLVRLGKLDAREIVNMIAEKRLGAIETSQPVSAIARPSDLFSDEVLDAIDRHYQIAWHDPSCTIYVPRERTQRVEPDE
jgi:hypothetical protein